LFLSHGWDTTIPIRSIVEANQRFPIVALKGRGFNRAINRPSVFRNQPTRQSRAVSIQEQNSVPHPFRFFLRKGWDPTNPMQDVFYQDTTSKPALSEVEGCRYSIPIHLESLFIFRRTRARFAHNYFPKAHTGRVNKNSQIPVKSVSDVTGLYRRQEAKNGLPPTPPYAILPFFQPAIVCNSHLINILQFYPIDE
jgi:hypothetical protein